MKNTDLSKWIANIAMKEILLMQEKFENYTNNLNNCESKDRPELKHKYNDFLINRFNEIKKILDQMSETVQIQIEDTGENNIVSKSGLHSEPLKILSRYSRFVEENETAYKYAEKAFNMDKSQEAKFLMAFSKKDINLKTGIFAGKKGKEALEDHHNNIKRLLIETIQMDPGSDYARVAGKYLILDYNYEFSRDDIFGIPVND